MTAKNMTTPQQHTRRRYLTTDPLTTSTSAPLPLLDTQTASQNYSTSFSLRKSATFHSPTSPPSQDDDPILNIPLLSRRSPTCPKALENAVAAGEKRVAHLISVVDRSLSGLEDFSSGSQETLRADDLPVPRFMIDAHVGELDRMDIDQPDHDACLPYRQRLAQKHHSSDSGIGSTVTDSEDLSLGGHTAQIKTESSEVLSTVREIRSGINGSNCSNADFQSGAKHALSEYACRQIQKHIILPIVRENSLKDFHPLIAGIPYRVGRKEITCLRDLEKVLLWLAPKWSVSRASFVKFCETSVQCIHTTVDYLNEPDQRRPTDRPYTNGYFLDLTEQVRQYAAMITASRARVAAGRRPAEDDYAPGETVRLNGGLSETGRPAELVRVKNGKSISLRTGTVVQPTSEASGFKAERPMSLESDDDIMRSMARRRKSTQPTVKDVQRCSDCDKVFKRPCDLTKHEKTHSRPWKCTESSCKYHHYGWPTEKERDRHVNDKHSATPSMYKCQYHPCPYESKRESNCKQHMEKAHGWAYVRSKNNGKTGRRPKNVKSPPTPQITTPGSYNFEASSPEFGEASSLYNVRDGSSVAHSVNGSVAASEESVPRSTIETPFMALEDTFGPFNANFQWNESYNAFNPPGPSEYTPGSHQESWDAASLTSAPTVPSSFEASLTQDPLFSENFDWSNLNSDFTSYNIQLITPASSVENKPLDAFSRHPSISLEQSLNAQVPSLSPGGHGSVMLFSPYSSNDAGNDEGYDEFVTDAGKPANDFPLFDGSIPTLSVDNTANAHMFQDLASMGPMNWSGRGTDLAHQPNMNDLMQTDEE